MTMQGDASGLKMPQMPGLGGMMGMGGGQAKWLMAAVLSAGEGGCTCTTCKLMKRFAAVMCKAMLEEEKGD